MAPVATALGTLTGFVSGIAVIVAVDPTAVPRETLVVCAATLGLVAALVSRAMMIGITGEEDNV